MTGAATAELQLGCLAIVLLYLALRLWREPSRAAFLGRFGLLMAASWLAEDTCIRLYGFYAYDPSWWGFIDQVPVLIVAIWPVVIHSALDLAEHLAGRGGAAPDDGEARARSARRVALIGALIVFTDAALIEPIAVRVGLWRWFEPGLFAVPPIGVLGWALFTALAMGIFRSRLHAAWVLLVAPVGTHLLLLATWWGALRHVSGPIDPWVGVGVAAAVALAVVARLLRGRGPWPAPALMLLRAPGAAFFFALLVIHALDDAALTAYALCFAAPWLTLVGLSLARRGTGASPDR